MTCKALHDLVFTYLFSLIFHCAPCSRHRSFFSFFNLFSVWTLLIFGKFHGIVVGDRTDTGKFRYHFPCSLAARGKGCDPGSANETLHLQLGQWQQWWPHAVPVSSFSRGSNCLAWLGNSLFSEPIFSSVCVGSLRLPIVYPIPFLFKGIQGSFCYLYLWRALTHNTL